VAVARGALYVREDVPRSASELFVLDRRTGAAAAPLPVPLIPAFSADSYLFSGANVQAFALDGGVEWTTDGGTTTVALPPITVGPHVVVATSDGTLSVLDARTGDTVSSLQVAGLADAGPGIGPEPASLTAADGLLFVPAGNVLSVY
jgi:outer membrane protein assembly factor BamB